MVNKLKKAEERLPFNLPIRKEDNSTEQLCKKYSALIWRQVDERKIEQILMQLASEMYGKGLAHMDRMHNQDVSPHKDIKY